MLLRKIFSSTLSPTLPRSVFRKAYKGAFYMSMKNKKVR